MKTFLEQAKEQFDTLSMKIESLEKAGGMTKEIQEIAEIVSEIQTKVDNRLKEYSES